MKHSKDNVQLFPCIVVRNAKTLCTHDSKRFLHAFYECCWKDSCSEAALLAGARQKLCEQNETNFQGGGVKVGLQEEEAPITSQGIEYGLLLTSES